jgi:hypothetical protein
MVVQWLGRGAVAMMLSMLAGLAPVRPAAGEPITVEVRAVPLDAAAPERTTLGPLRYRGGIAIRSGHNRFGGLSGLAFIEFGALFNSFEVM